jgi:hypothetical protein
MDVDNVAKLYQEQRDGTALGDIDSAAELVGLASDESRMGEAPPRGGWPRVRVYDVHMYLRQPMVASVTRTDNDVTFTLHGSKFEDGISISTHVQPVHLSRAGQVLDPPVGSFHSSRELANGRRILPDRRAAAAPRGFPRQTG